MCSDAADRDSGAYRTDLEARNLLQLASAWHREAHKARTAAEEMPNLLARGHLLGLSDGLDLAARQIGELLNKQLPDVPR